MQQLQMRGRPVSSTTRWSRLSRASRVVQGVRAVATPLSSPPTPAKPSGKGGFQPRVVSEEGCKFFVDPIDGSYIAPMCADYGFRSGAGRLYEERYGEVPDDVWSLAKQNFTQELLQLRRSVRFSTMRELLARKPPTSLQAKLSSQVGLASTEALAKLDSWLEGSGVLPKLEPPPVNTELESEEFREVRSKLDRLVLDNAAVARYEQRRVASMGETPSPLWVKAPFLALCWLLDLLYEGRPIQKFWVLETVARIPYFAYISILHLYESLGFWRAGAELRKIHFAEEWNEMHHLQIMESLGGDQLWWDRFIAEHAAVFYYWLLIAFYLVSPKLAYNFMERVEWHAADTYSEFVSANGDILKDIPPPMVALNYYRSGDLYLFDEFQTGRKGPPRRPDCNNLLDVFTNIRDDELEHVKTMDACQHNKIAEKLVVRDP